MTEIKKVYDHTYKVELSDGTASLITDFYLKNHYNEEDLEPAIRAFVHEPLEQQRSILRLFKIETMRTLTQDEWLVFIDTYDINPEQSV